MDTLIVDSRKDVKNQKKVIDSVTVLAALEKIVNEAGLDYVYQEHFDRCVNFVIDPKNISRYIPACIVGRFFDSLGLTIRECGNSTVEASIRELKDTAPHLKFTDAAVLILATAQSVQDNKGTYGNVINTVMRVSRVMRQFRERDGRVEY